MQIKEARPDDFDGSDKTEWVDYIVHFEQCAAINNWPDSRKAQMLSIRLKDQARTLLSDLTPEYSLKCVVIIQLFRCQVA